MRTVEGGEVTSKELGLLEQGETATFAARPSYVTVGAGDHWDLPLLLLTDRRMVVSKDKLIGKRKADFFRRLVRNRQSQRRAVEW